MLAAQEEVEEEEEEEEANSFHLVFIGFRGGERRERKEGGKTREEVS